LELHFLYDIITELQESLDCYKCNLLAQAGKNTDPKFKEFLRLAKAAEDDKFSILRAKLQQKLIDNIERNLLSALEELGIKDKGALMQSKPNSSKLQAILEVWYRTGLEEALKDTINNCYVEFLTENGSLIHSMVEKKIEALKFAFPYLQTKGAAEAIIEKHKLKTLKRMYQPLDGDSMGDLHPVVKGLVITLAVPFVISIAALLIPLAILVGPLIAIDFYLLRANFDKILKAFLKEKMKGLNAKKGELKKICEQVSCKLISGLERDYEDKINKIIAHRKENAQKINIKYLKDEHEIDYEELEQIEDWLRNVHQEMEIALAKS